MIWKNKKDVTIIWSNVFFLFPLAIALGQGLYLYSSVILVATVTSFIFHANTKSTAWRWIDHVTADILIISNFVLFYKTGFLNLYFATAMLLAFVALTFYFKTSKQNYVINHTVWHILSAAISALSVLGFIK